MSCLQPLISGIGWRHRTRWVGCWIQVRWRLVRGTCILLMISYCAYMTCWTKAPVRARGSGSHSLVAAVSDRNWTQNPIVKGKNFLFFTLIIGWVFFTVLGETNSQEISINRPRKCADHAYFGRDEIWPHCSVRMSSQAARV